MANLPSPELIQTTRQRVKERFLLAEDPTVIFEKTAGQLKEGTCFAPENKLDTAKATYTLGFENDYTLVETVDEHLRGLAIELRRQLIIDFGCTTYAEKVLVDGVVSGYMRHLKAAKEFNFTINQGRISPNMTEYLKVLNKEMDSANRQLQSAYQLLVNLKRPPVNVQIKTQTAFVAQNQQVNV